MALQQPQQYAISEADYLSGELLSNIKHEYIDGQVYAMTGTSRNHARIITNLSAHLHGHLTDKPCDVFINDLKVKAQRNFFYPDIIVECGQQPGDAYYTETPLLIVEVLSKSTRRLDHTLKRSAYQNLPSLQEYVLIEQDFVDIEVCRRSNHWQPEHYFLGDELYLPALELRIPVATVYARVDNEDMLAFLSAPQSPQAQS